MLKFKLKRQFHQALKEHLLAAFAEEKDGLEFMQSKLAWDHKTKVNAFYRLYHDEDLIREADSALQETLSSLEGTTSAGANGGTQSSRFSPSPFSSASQPAGTKSSFRKDQEQDDEDF